MSFYSQHFLHLIVERGSDTLSNCLWVSLNYPQKANCLTDAMIDSLVKVLLHADRDQSIWVIVLTGMGKSFCSGGDVKSMETQEGMFSGGANCLRENYIHGIQKIPKTIESMQTPIIAMINGPAIGAGHDLALMCDIRIASKKALFGSTFTKIGLVPGDGGALFLQRVAGYSRAMEMLLTSKVIDAKQAYEWNLINFAPILSENLKLKTTELVQQILNNSPIAVALTKKAIKSAYKSSLLDEHLDLMASYQAISQRTKDHLNALESLKKKNFRPDFEYF